MTLKDRLREAMAGPPKVTQAALARGVKVSQPTVNDWLSGKSKTIRGPILVRVAAFLGVSAEWLATGKGARVHHAGGEVNVKSGRREVGDPSQNEKLDDVILATAELWVRVEEGAGRKLHPVRRLQRKLEIAGMIQADGGGLSPEHSQQLLDAARQGVWDESDSGGDD
jgi:transcriptional regulator with XRE-family HTH domain